MRPLVELAALGVVNDPSPQESLREIVKGSGRCGCWSRTSKEVLVDVVATECSMLECDIHMNQITSLFSVCRPVAFIFSKTKPKQNNNKELYYSRSVV